MAKLMPSSAAPIGPEAAETAIGSGVGYTFGPVGAKGCDYA